MTTCRNALRLTETAFKVKLKASMAWFGETERIIPATPPPILFLREKQG